MKHIVYCWEMGDGLGHIVPLAALARAMAARGQRVTCVLKEPAHAPALLGGIDGVRWLAAPRAIELRQRLAKTINLADVLYNNAGFSDPGVLAALLRAWRNIFATLRPDRVVCDFSPTARLAALSLGLEVVCIDSGFSRPPLPRDARAPLPGFFLAQRDDPAPLIAAEARTLDVANRALRILGAPALPNFSALFSGEVWYRNWIEFNHFGPHSASRHLGQIAGGATGATAQWQQDASPRLFAYLKPGHPHSLAILKAALGQRFSVLAYLPGFGKAELAELESHPLFRSSPTPLNLDTLPDDVEIGIWHSPTGAVSHCLGKGMRMIFLPRHPEQELACAAVQGAGFTAYVIKKHQAKNWCKVFERVRSWPRVAVTNRWRPADAHDFAAKLTNGV